MAEVPSADTFDWFPDGKWVVLDGLRLLSVETGEVRSLTKPPAESIQDETPAVSPDGRAVTFARSLGSNVLDIFSLDLGKDLKPKGSPKRLTSRNRSSAFPRWTPDGRQIIFQSAKGQHLSLWRVAASGSGSLEQVPYGQGQSAERPQLSRDGKRLAYTRSTTDLNIWRLPLSEAGRAAGPPTPYLSSTFGELVPRYSRDGKRIAFESDRSGDDGIWVSDNEGSNVRELPLLIRDHVGSPSWSPDGHSLAFDTDSDLYVVPATGGQPVRLIAATGATRNVMSEWSHDGKWIYFTKLRAAECDIWRIPAAGGDAVQITSNGGNAAIESPDGRFLYYTKESLPSPLYRMPAGGGDEIQVLPSVVWRNYAVVRDGIYFIPKPGADGKHSIQFLNFATRKVQTVAQYLEPRTRRLRRFP